MNSDDLTPVAQSEPPARFIGVDDADLIVRTYLALEERQLDVLRIVPYEPSNWDVKLLPLGGIILEACSLVDSVLRASMQTDKDRNDLSMRDYPSHYESACQLSGLHSFIFQMPYEMIAPFSGWTKQPSQEGQLPWWTAYNGIKHDMVRSASLCTIRNSILSLCALQQAIAVQPDFLEALSRHDMLSAYNISTFIEFVRSKTVYNQTATVESALFATAIGYSRFPSQWTELYHPDFYGGSKRLAKFLCL